MTGDLRSWMALCEAAEPPSQALLYVVKGWIDGWSEQERSAIEAALWEHRAEARKFLAPRYGVLYRGMTITDAQIAELRDGKPIMAAMPRLASWTKSRAMVQDWADAGGLLVMKRGLKPVLDIARIISFFPEEIDDDGELLDYLRYGRREKEVVCEHDGPMRINPAEATIIG